jgi:uncharacterized protein with PIN domain
MRITNKVSIRFYEELNDFIEPENYKRDIVFKLFGSPTVKDVIESFGVPHTEVDLILVNGVSVNFDYHLKPDDHISVYPKFESFDIHEITQLRSEPLREVKFILDVHLGKLAKFLRLLGFDSIYKNQQDDKTIIQTAKHEKRIILTRDIGILKHNEVTHGYYVRSDDPKKQLGEIIQRFDLKDQVNPFTRCLECNGLLKQTDKDKISHQLDEATRKYYDTFYICRECQKIYWKGSHYKDMIEFINKTLK